MDFTQQELFAIAGWALDKAAAALRQKPQNRYAYDEAHAIYEKVQTEYEQRKGRAE